jgi:hypothetical protein
LVYENHNGILGVEQLSAMFTGRYGFVSDNEHDSCHRLTAFASVYIAAWNTRFRIPSDVNVDWMAMFDLCYHLFSTVPNQHLQYFSGDGFYANLDFYARILPRSDFPQDSTKGSKARSINLVFECFTIRAKG